MPSRHFTPGGSPARALPPRGSVFPSWISWRKFETNRPFPRALDPAELEHLRNPEDPDALVAFVKRHRMPLLDRDGATFLFDPEGRDVRSVRLHHSIHMLGEIPFEKSKKCGIFFARLPLPWGSRIEYSLALTHANGHTEMIPDPRNPDMAWCPFGGKSVVRMGGYQLPAFCNRDDHGRHGRHGSVTELAFHSNVYGDERTVRIHHPATVSPGEALPVVVVFDGSDYINYSEMLIVLDNLHAKREVAPFVTVFSDPRDRTHEYAANPANAEFLVQDLLPAVEKRHPLLPGRDNRALLGASFGGVASLSAAMEKPDHFSKLVLQSGSFMMQHGCGEAGCQYDRLSRFVRGLERRRPAHEFRMYLSCGVFEALVYDLRQFVSKLDTYGYEYTYVESFDSHNWHGWRDRLGEALSFIFPLSPLAALANAHARSPRKSH